MAAAHHFAARPLLWIFVLCAVTACSNSDGTPTTTGYEGTPLLGCQKGPASGPPSLIVETPSTGFAILRSQSQHNMTAPGGLGCCQVQENLSAQKCG